MVRPLAALDRPARAGADRRAASTRRSATGAPLLDAFDPPRRRSTTPRRSSATRPDGFLVRCSWGDGLGHGRLRGRDRGLPRGGDGRELRRRGLTERRRRPRAARGRARARARGRGRVRRGAGAPRASQSAIAASSQPGAPQRAASSTARAKWRGGLVRAARRRRPARPSGRATGPNAAHASSITALRSACGASALAQLRRPAPASRRGDRLGEQRRARRASPACAGSPAKPSRAHALRRLRARAVRAQPHSACASIASHTGSAG